MVTNDELQRIGALDTVGLHAAIQELQEMSVAELEAHVNKLIESGSLPTVAERIRSSRLQHNFASDFVVHPGASSLTQVIGGFPASAQPALQAVRGESIDERASRWHPPPSTIAAAYTRDEIVLEFVAALAGSAAGSEFAERLWVQLPHPTEQLYQAWSPPADPTDFSYVMSLEHAHAVLGAYTVLSSAVASRMRITRDKTVAWLNAVLASPRGRALLRSLDEAIPHDGLDAGPSEHRKAWIDDVAAVGHPDSAILALLLAYQCDFVAAGQLVETAVTVAVATAIRGPGPTAGVELTIVNPALYSFASFPWFELILDWGKDWVPGFFAQFYADKSDKFLDEEDLLRLGVEDLAPWIRGWRNDAQRQLADSIVFDLYHRPDELASAINDQDAWSDPIANFWMPLHEAVFGPVPNEPVRSTCRVLAPGEGSERLDAWKDELGRPNWPWLEAAECALRDAVVEQLGYCYVGNDLDYVQRTLHPPTPVTGDPDRSFRDRGIGALDSALQWFDQGHEDLWPIPKDDEELPRYPYRRDRRRLYTVSVICSERRADDLDVRVYLPIDEFHDALVDAGQAIGLAASDKIEQNILRALELENFGRSSRRMFQAWAVTAQALLDAYDRDHFLKIETSSPLYDRPQMRRRIKEHLDRLNSREQVSSF